MDEEAAHQLYQDFRQVDAAARQKQGLGFVAGHAPATDREAAQHQHDTEVLHSRKRVKGHEDEAAEGLNSRRSKHTARSTSPPARHSVHRSRQPNEDSHRDFGQNKHCSREKLESQVIRNSSRDRDGQGAPQGRSRDRRDRRDRDSGDRTSRDRSRIGGQGSRDRDRNRSKGRERCSSRDRDREWHPARQRDSGRDRHAETRRERDRYSSRDRDSYRDRHRSRSKSRDRQGGRRPPAAGTAGCKAGVGKQTPDFAVLIEGYSDMTPAQRMRAKTKLLLERSSAQDADKQKDEPGGSQWTRFVFNKDALLEEEGAIPQGLEETGRTAHGSHAAEADRSHEAAIFGAPAKPERRQGRNGVPESISHSIVRNSSHDQYAATAHELGSFPGDEQPVVVGAAEVTTAAAISAHDNADVVEASQAPVAKASWRERALQLQTQRAAQGNALPV